MSADTSLSSNEARQVADCVIEIRAGHDDVYLVTMRLTQPDGAADTTLVHNAPFTLNQTALLEVSDAVTYGQLLSAQFFSNPGIRSAWERAMAYSAGTNQGIRLRLRLAGDTVALHGLRWESLYDPNAQSPLALNERVRFSRYIETELLTPVTIPEYPHLSVVVAVANPTNLGIFNRSEIDVEGEVGRVHHALRSMQVTIIGNHNDSIERRASLNTLTGALRGQNQICYLVCHGAMIDQEAYLWLENEHGQADRVSGTAFVATIAQMERPPLLIVLASCYGAGAGDERAFMAIGPRLAEAGVPAVLAMQGLVSKETIRTLMPTLFQELLRDGVIDRALAVARSTLRQSGDWWKPVLFSRLNHGQLWRKRVLAAPASSHARGQSFNRRKELELYTNLLRFEQTTRVLLIQDKQGTGKSNLLQQFKQYALGQRIPVSLIDIKTHAQHSPLAIADEIYNDLSEAPTPFVFTHYEEARRVARNRSWSQNIGQIQAVRASLTETELSAHFGGSAEQPPSSLTLDTNEERDLLRRFVRDLHAGCNERPAVILIDSYELASAEIGRWLQERLFPGLFYIQEPLAPNLLLVIAGKETPAFASNQLADTHTDLIQHISSLSYWTEEDIVECMQAYNVTPEADVVRLLARQAQRGLPTIALVSFIQGQAMIQSR